MHMLTRKGFQWLSAGAASSSSSFLGGAGSAPAGKAAWLARRPLPRTRLLTSVS